MVSSRGLGDGYKRQVVLADPEDVDAEGVGELTLREDLADDGGRRQRLPVAVEGDVAEGVETELEIHDPIPAGRGSGCVVGARP